jgi:hypothetical protein
VLAPLAGQAQQEAKRETFPRFHCCGHTRSTLQSRLIGIRPLPAAVERSDAGHGGFLFDNVIFPLILRNSDAWLRKSPLITW